MESLLSTGPTPSSFNIFWLVLLPNNFKFFCLPFFKIFSYKKMLLNFAKAIFKKLCFTMFLLFYKTILIFNSQSSELICSVLVSILNPLSTTACTKVPLDTARFIKGGGTCYLVLGTCYSVLGTWFLVLSAWPGWYPAPVQPLPLAVSTEIRVIQPWHHWPGGGAEETKTT